MYFEGLDDNVLHGGDWGDDTVEQLAGGTVNLRFATGSEENWDTAALTCTDGDNSVRVIGVSQENITLTFGGDIYDGPRHAFADLLPERSLRRTEPMV